MIKMILSMSRPVNAYDSASCESFINGFRQPPLTFSVLRGQSFESCLDELMADDSRGYAIEFEANLGKLRFV